MKALLIFIKNNYKEIIFQLIVAGLLFFYYSFNESITVYRNVSLVKLVPYEISFFLNYALAAMLINYVLLPKVYSKQKFLSFFLFVCLSIILVILIDEFVLEQIYFPDTRGTYFPGILFTLTETLPIIVFFVGFKFAWDFNRKQKEIEKLKSLVQESELQFLKSQINPHFLFNNLNNLYAHAIEKSVKTPSIILELSSVLRYMLYGCKEKYVPLQKEITHLKNYTALNELQIEHRGDVKFNTNIVSDNFTIAPLILTVFIENAFKHSMASQSEDITIHINIDSSKDGVLSFNCRNSFLPYSNTEKLSNGIGLDNVKKRLNILYPNAHELIIKAHANFYEVYLSMQLKSIAI